MVRVRSRGRGRGWVAVRVGVVVSAEAQDFSVDFHCKRVAIFLTWKHLPTMETPSFHGNTFLIW